MDFLEFERPIWELLKKINELRHTSEVNVDDEIALLEKKCSKLTKDIYSNLTSHQVVKVARHPQRPHSSDYISRIFTDFHELRGDRHFADDQAIIGGLARFNGESCMVIGQEKGREVDEKILRNFGMPHPEGYRKALRLYKLAEKYGLPIIALIDTPGAYPGIGAEERNQSEAIATNLFAMTTLKTRIINVIIGEGSSGGALGIGVGDRLLMLGYSVYAVISPEGCASILWKSAEKASEAADAMKMTASALAHSSIVDTVIAEPNGGAHRNPDQMAASLAAVLQEHLTELNAMDLQEVLDKRYQRLVADPKFASD